jgi:hypothetical protein
MGKFNGSADGTLYQELPNALAMRNMPFQPGSTGTIYSALLAITSGFTVADAACQPTSHDDADFVRLSGSFAFHFGQWTDNAILWASRMPIPRCCTPGA